MIRLDGALRLVFADPAWLNRLGILALMTAAAFLLTPFIIGLLIWAALFGVQVQIIARVRAGDPRPLPPITSGRNFGQEFNRALQIGVAPLLVFALYMLPNLILYGISSFTSVLGGDTTIGGGLSALQVCCFFPVLIIYNAVVWPFFTIGMARYGETRNWLDFFRYGAHWQVIAPQINATILYLAWGLLIILAIGVLAVIPVLGWIVFAGLLIPATGLLGGLYAAAVLGKPKT